MSGCLALARGAVEIAGTRLADVAARLERRGAYDLLPLPVAALTRLRVRRNDLDAATAVVRRFDREAAAAEITAAMDTFQRLAASWDLDRASAAARRYGVPVLTRHRRGPKGYGTDLSPREQAVAELAAAGRTNQQIADELFVSVNTVKKQLASAMRKLGVTSRSALFHRLGEVSRPH